MLIEFVGDSLLNGVVRHVVDLWLDQHFGASSGGFGVKLALEGGELTTQVLVSLIRGISLDA
jgi:hypothetical protein